MAIADTSLSSAPINASSGRRTAMESDKQTALLTRLIGYGS
jgi:hypothetical protein